MGEETVVNPDIQETVINSEIGQATAVNPDVFDRESKKIPPVRLQQT